MCDMCGIVSTTLKPESSYWRKMCEHITKTQNASFQESGCSASSSCDFFEKIVAGNKCFAIFSGKLSNCDKMRQTLQQRGVAFEGESRAELVLNAYLLFGKSYFKNFHGEFSAAIWDGYEQELLLLRDKIGFRPLFYYFDGLRLVFASKIRGILSFPFVKKEFCDDIYCKLFTLAGSKPEFDTFFNYVYEVPPATVVSYKAGKIKIWNYFMFDMESTADSFSQTVRGFDFLLADKPEGTVMTEKTMTQDELKDKIEEYVSRADLPSPYIDLTDLSNIGSSEKFLCNMNLFNIPKRFKLPVKRCEIRDTEFINELLSTIPTFSFKDKKDIVEKEEIYLKTSIVLPQVISAKRIICENVSFPYLSEQVLEYSIKSKRYRQKLLKDYFYCKKPRPLRENIKVLKSLFYDMIKSENLMLGMIQKEELLRFTRLFPRPETMLYLLQVNAWLNIFL